MGPRGRAVRRTALLLVALASALAGCQTARSWQQGCPGVYSGVRYYRDQLGFVPLDGKIFFTLDLPLSATLDTLLLPASWAVTPVEPRGGFPPGCRWASGR